MSSASWRWIRAASAVFVLFLAVGWWAAQHWLGSDDFRGRAEQVATDAVGVPVHFGRIRLDLLPLPGLALEEVRVQTQPVGGIGRLEVRAVLGALLQGRLELASLSIHAADFSQAGWEDLLARRSKAPPAPQGTKAALPWPRMVRVEGLTWRPLAGAPIMLDARANLAPDGLPDTLEAQVRGGLLQGLDLALTRKQLTWVVRAAYAGGTVQGPVTLDQLPAVGTGLTLNGRLVTEGLDVGVVSQRRLTGRLSATTTLGLRTGGPGPLLAALQTQSQFTVRSAVVHGVDLARAVRTVGLSRGGETRLDTLAGQVNTRGRVVQLSNLVASSGLLTASGEVNLLANQALRGRVLVHLGPAAVGQAMGVPLVVAGTLEDPQLTLTRSALLGAAIGTMVMPGVGTGAGASIGDKIGNSIQGLFGK